MKNNNKNISSGCCSYWRSNSTGEKWGWWKKRGAKFCWFLDDNSVRAHVLLHKKQKEFSLEKIGKEEEEEEEKICEKCRHATAAGEHG